MRQDETQPADKTNVTEASADADEQATAAQELPFPNVVPAEVHVSAEWKYTAPFVSGRFHPNGNWAFAGAQDNTVQRIRVSDGAFTSLASHDSWVRAIHFSPDGNSVITGGYDGRLIWWPAHDEQPAPVRRVDAHAGWIRNIVRSPDGSHLATCGDDRFVKIWNTESGELAAQLEGHAKNVYSVLYHPDGKHLFSADLAGVVKKWDLSSSQEVQELDASALHTYNGGQRVDFGGVRSLAISPDGKQLACSGLHNASNPLGSVHEPLVMLFDLETATVLHSFVTGDLKGGVWRVMFHPNGFLVGATSGTSGGFLLFWNQAQDKDFHRLKLPQVARDLDLHPDGMQLLTPHFDNHVRVSRMEKKPA